MNADHELDPLLDAMVWPAAQLVGHVRNRDAEGVAEILGPLDGRGLHALAIALACLVPDDQSVGQLALWSHGPHVPDDQLALSIAADLNAVIKPCSRCHTPRQEEDFARDASKADGRKTQCRACTSELRRERLAGSDTNRSRTARCAPQRQREAA